MVKKIFALCLCLVSMINLVGATNSYSNSTEAAHNAQIEISEKYLELCEEYPDESSAFSALLLLYPSLTVVSQSNHYFDSQGNMVIPTRAVSKGEDINLMGDTLVFDSDYNTYVYFGYWSWNKFPSVTDEINLSPYDFIGFYTQSSDELYPTDYFVYGYDNQSNNTAIYNSASQITSGKIFKGVDTPSGAAFWIDERYVRRGRMVVPLDYKSGSKKKVMMQYCHNWTKANVTGIGGQVSVGGGGFQISWDTGVYHWEDMATSPGARLP